MLIAVTVLTSGTHIDLLQNFTGNFGINGQNSINGRNRGYHVWIIAGGNIYNLSQENSSIVNTIYTISVNFTSTNTLPCAEQYLYIYKQSSSFSNATTLLTATFTGTDLQSGSVLIQSSIVTVVYNYAGQSDAIGLNATYSIVPLFTTTTVRPSNS